MRLLRPILLTLTLLISPAVAQRTRTTDAARDNIQSTDEWYLPTGDKAAQLYVYEIGHGEPVVVLMKFR